MNWAAHVLQYVERGTPVCRVLVAEARGSAPRDAGAQMYVTENGIEETIGGGTLEYEVMAIARKAIGDAAKKPDGFYRHWQHFALGPNLGQCCGGNVTMLFEAFDTKAKDKLTALEKNSGKNFLHHSDHDTWPDANNNATDPAPHYDKKNQTLTMPTTAAKPPLYIYGAGHVGRALIAATAGLGLARSWVDSARDRFPEKIPDDVTAIPAKDMAIIAAHAEAGAMHIVLTYSHRIDEDIVAALLRADNFFRLGLIGSKTKRARFISSLGKAGFAKSALEKIICPIGLTQITGKQPPHVALSIAGQIAVWLEEAA